MFGRLLKNDRGNFAIISALCAVPIIAICGASLDFMMMQSAKQRLQGALDSAVLSATNFNNDADVETVVNEFIKANLGTTLNHLSDDIDVTVKSSRVLNSKSVEVTAAAEIQTYFIGLIGIDTLPISAASAANQSISNVEISVVLDISSSMAGTKLTNLKDAANEFVEEMLDEDDEATTSISIVPFGGTVNVGKDLFDLLIASAGAGLWDPSKTEYHLKSGVLDQSFRFSDGDYCVEYSSEDYDDVVDRDASRAQVPHFWKWYNFNPWCPTKDSSVLFNSNNTEELTDMINGLTLSDGTGMDVGTLWGFNALSPTWVGTLGGSFADRPAPFDEETLKVMIIMTDGNITAQLRPKDTSLNTVGANGTEPNTDYGNGVSTKQNTGNQQSVVSKGSASSSASSNNAVGYFKRVCDNSKEAGVVIYTIGFRISTDSIADQLLQYCMSDSSKYYFVEDFDIAAAFDAIAASIDALRLTS